ncbi:hypothetical protein QE152_g26102 [Popillia japonica]|uniref:Uncharacterized protein n=1 Tax=Popillia japonica TaxID=7064 RepID=A0AAW1JZ02_POPJA
MQENDNAERSEKITLKYAPLWFSDSWNKHFPETYAVDIETETNSEGGCNLPEDIPLSMFQKKWIGKHQELVGIENMLHQVSDDHFRRMKFKLENE